MKDNIVDHLLQIKENYLKTGDVKELEKAINELPPEMVELFKAMNQNEEN
jgi:DNA polymerase/3'-5' exonuclease PolX